MRTPAIRARGYEYQHPRVMRLVGECSEAILTLMNRICRTVHIWMHGWVDSWADLMKSPSKNSIDSIQGKIGH